MNNKEPLYDLSAFRLMDEEEPGAFNKIITVFIDTTPGILTDLNKAFQERELDNVAHYAHKLKATIDIFTIKPLMGLIRQAEQSALSGDTSEELPGMIETINMTMADVISKIKEEIS
jgi:HPt (histidine-containing phosphotransfer) domain-containing protein